MDSVNDKLPDRIDGSASNLSAVVNGVELQFASVDIALVNVDRASIVHLGEIGEVEPFEFALEGSVSDRTVDRWVLNIWQDSAGIVKTIAGQGALPERIVWDETDEIESLMKPGLVYFYQLELEEPGTRAKSRRGMFGVNRSTAVSLKLAGGAFIVNSAVLTDRARSLLGKSAEIMREHPDEVVQINGHTDSVGSRLNNQLLSERRARSAYNYLVDVAGIAADRFAVTGFGEDQPVAGNDTASGREMNRRVEIVGELTEVERAHLYQTRTNELLAVMNGRAMELGAYGQFHTLLDGAGVDKVELQMTDETGRGIDTTIALPLLQVIQPSGMKYRPFPDEQSWSREAGLVPPDASFGYHLVGMTDSGNYVELDKQPLAVDVTGRFESPLTLRPGRNTFVLSARNAKGFVRYANVQVMVKTDNYGEPILAVEPIPKLVLQLPPTGVPMRNANLVVPGYTDPGNTIRINQQAVEIDENGHFFTSMPLRFGMNTIVTIVTDPDGYTGSITRDVEYTGDALFIMALAEGKISQITRKGNLQAAGADSVDEVKMRYT